MPSGAKKRRASRRKLAEGELVSSTAGATDSCIGSMVSNDAVQLSQQVEEHVTDVVPSTESLALKELNEAVPVSQQVEEHVSNTFLESEVMEFPMSKENDVSAVAEVVSCVVVCETCLSEVAVENEIGPKETNVAEVSNVGVDGEHGDVVKEFDITKSNEGVAVPEVVSSEVAVESDGIVVGVAQLSSKKDNKDIELFSGEGKDSPSLNGGCMSVEQADNSQDVGLNVKEPSAGVADDEGNVFDVLPSKEPPPLKELNDAVQVSQQVEEHACNMKQEHVLMELLNGKAENMAKLYDHFNCVFCVPEVLSGVEVSEPVVAVQNDMVSNAKLAAKRDEKDSELFARKELSHTVGIGVDSALTGSFPKLLDLIEQIEHLVQEAKALMAQ